MIQNEEIKENVEIQKQCRNRILNKDFNSLSDDEITFLFEMVITEVMKRLKEEKEFTSSMDLAERQDKYKALLDPSSLELIINIKGKEVSKLSHLAERPKRSTDFTEGNRMSRRKGRSI